jgi:acetoin utilization protein AcuB
MKNKILNIAVDEYSSPIQLFATEDMKVSKIKSLMHDRGYRHIPVLRSNKPIGIITDRDIAIVNTLKFSEDFLANEVMVRDPYCVPSGSSLEEVAFEMSKRKIGSAIVLNRLGEAESIFTSIDGLNAIIEILRGDVDN